MSKGVIKYSSLVLPLLDFDPVALPVGCISWCWCPRSFGRLRSYGEREYTYQARVTDDHDACSAKMRLQRPQQWLIRRKKSREDSNKTEQQRHKLLC